MAPFIQNPPAPGVSYFTPAQYPPSGTAEGDNVPLLFKPIKIRGVEFQNRIWVRPLAFNPPQLHSPYQVAVN